MRKRISGGECRDTLIAMNNLALMYEKQGRIVEAIKLLEDGLEKLKLALGEAHPDTQTMTENLERLRQQTDDTKPQGGEVNLG